LIFVIACDDGLTPKDYDEASPFVKDLIVNPSEINFDPVLDGQKDTTITFELNVKGFNFETDAVPYYFVFIGDDDVPLIQEKFPVNFSQITTFQTSFSIETNTIDFESYKILVTPTVEGRNSNFAQAVVSQTGLPTNPPEILEVNNPSNVEIPNDDAQVAVLFTAKVRDLDGQSNIDKVLLNFRNEDGSLLSVDPFQLFDNGSSSNGDNAVADSVYSTIFQINNTNTPNNRTALYWAIDKSGLSSDTLETPFNLTEND
jgi:hypothetical protein